MARYRIIKPEFFADEKLAGITLEARLVFVGLWCFCDDNGRKPYSLHRIKRELFPDDDVGLKQIDGWIKELAKAGVIRIYTVDGENFIWLPHFLRHQRIDRPGHSENPPHPKDPAPECNCGRCKQKRGERVDRSLIHSKGNGAVPAGTIPGTDSTNEFDESNHGINSDCIGLDGNGKNLRADKIETVENTHTGDFSQEFAGNERPTRVTENGGKDRNSPFEALDSLARGMLEILSIPPNSKVLEALTESIRVKARTKGTSIELAAHNIAGKAAVIRQDASPDSWTLWFADARYDYVPEGDKRLTERGEVARPVCGGSLCSEGWEIVTVGDRRYRRRCPDCARLWEDA